MNLPQRAAQLSLAAIFTLFGFASAHACSCAATSPCQAAGSADAVFIARATDEHRATRELPDWDDKTKTIPESVTVSTLQVDQVFFGLSNQVIDLWGYNTTCDYSFEVGKTYLVFAHQAPDGKWSTNACSHTHRLENAKEELVFLRSSGKVTGGVLNGSVKRTVYDRNFYWSERGLDRVSVYLVSATNKYRAVTDALGNFELRNLVGGRYKVYTDPATNQSNAGDVNGPPKSEWTVEIPNQGCKTLWFNASPAGGVSGRVFSGNELINRNLNVELAPVGIAINAENVFSQTLGEDGEFRFDFIPPGRYYLGINLIPDSSDFPAVPSTFYPGALSRDTASIVEIGQDQQLSGYDIRLPDSVRLRTVEGVVLRNDGTPVASASVEFRNIQVGDSDSGTAQTGPDGKFSFQGIEGQTYDLFPHTFNEGGGAVLPLRQVKIGTTNAPVELTIGQPAK